jgi:glycosyltransferase involved in cell wall biosynthesis
MAPPASAPSVSVVIPTFNRRDLLLVTLESVFAQTFRDFEVLIVDDGSTDGTSGVLAPLVADGLVRHVTQTNEGPARARNTGVECALGEFVALLDDDDLWPADKLEWQVHELRAHPEAVLVYGYSSSFGMERPFRWPPPDAPAGWVREAFLAKNWVRTPGQTLIRASAIRSVGGFDPALWSADDWDLYLRLAAAGPFIYQDRLALRYRSHDRNLSKRAWLLYRHACRVHRRHDGAFPRPSNARRWLGCRASLLNMLKNELKGSWRAAMGQWSGR